MNVYSCYKTPLGILTIQACDEGLLGAWFETQTTQPDNLGIPDDEHPIVKQAIGEYQEYFAGKRKIFTVAIAVKGTKFQQQVWQTLTTIPYGTTWSYQQLASAIKNPKAVRAVGHANAKNPLSIIVPCHRVIGKNGALTGYNGGIECKAELLKLEKSLLV